MIKIKKDVDLKKLKEYGFKINKKAYYRCKRNNYIKYTKNGCIEIENDTLWITWDGMCFLREDEIEYQNNLYKLIKDGLVEEII